MRSNISTLHYWLFKILSIELISLIDDHDNNNYSEPSATNTQVTLNTTAATPTATALPTQTQHMDRDHRVDPNFGMTQTRTAHTANTTIIHSITDLAVIMREISSFCRPT